MESSQTSGAAGQAQEKAQETAQQAAGKAREQVRAQVDQRSTQAGEQVGSTASDMRSVAEQLREQGKDQPAKLAEQAADRAERLGSYLKESDADRILNDVEDFGRRQPMAVMLGGLALGFAASRVLKASSRNRYEGGRTAPATAPPRPPAPVPSQTALPPAPEFRDPSATPHGAPVVAPTTGVAR